MIAGWGSCSSFAAAKDQLDNEVKKDDGQRAALFHSRVNGYFRSLTKWVYDFGSGSSEIILSRKNSKPKLGANSLQHTRFYARQFKPSAEGMPRLGVYYY